MVDIAFLITNTTKGVAPHAHLQFFIFRYIVEVYKKFSNQIDSPWCGIANYILLCNY